MHGSRVQTWPRWALLALMFLGIAALWGFCCGSLMVVWLMPEPPSDTYVTLGVTYAGEPVLVTSDASTGKLTRQPRTLSGEDLPRKTPIILVAASVSPEPRPRRFWDGPPRWESERMASSENLFYANVSRDPNLSTTWYLVTDGSKHARGYLLGFDKQSKLNAGSIGRNGWVAGTPSRDEQFVTNGLAGRHQVLAPRSDGQLSIFFFDEDRLLSVNLATHAVQTLVTIPDGGSMSYARVTSNPGKAALEAAARIARDGRDADDPNFEFGDPRLVIRSGRALLLVDPASGDHVDFELPTDVSRDTRLEAYCVSEEQVVVSYALNPSQPHARTLAWLAAEGSVDPEAAKRVEKVQLPGSLPTPEHQGIVFCAAAPIPAVLAFATFILGPWGAIAGGHAVTYVEALWHALRTLAPGLIVVAVFTASMAWYVYRRERVQGGRRAGWLAALVFALGVSGFLAYLATRSRAPMGRCAACGANVPQNRALCAGCGSERARPRMTGVEVFA
jgi:hypothetical protein